VYRWWPNKAALVVDAFVSVAEETLRYPQTGPAEKTIREQMKRWTLVFRSPLGRVIAEVIGAGQSEPEMLAAFHRYYVEPRRAEARELLKEGVQNGEIRADLGFDTILDVLYGPLYLRFLLQKGPLTLDFVDEVFDIVSPGLHPR
jgi:hypothetical protein